MRIKYLVIRIMEASKKEVLSSMDEFIQNTEQVLEYLEQKKACSTIIVNV